MATYNTNFSGYAADAQPSDWTARWVTADNNWLVKAKAGTSGGKVLENTGTVDGHHFLSWDAVDADAGRADVEILALMRSTSSTTNQFRLTARGSGAAGSETGYCISFNDVANRFQLFKLVAGTRTNLGSFVVSTLSTNTLHYVLFRVNGSNLMAKTWLETDPVPTDWIVTATDSSITDPGWVGVGNEESTGTRDFDFVSIGTNGDSAPFVTDPDTVIRASQAVLETAYYGGPAPAFLSHAVLEVGFVNAPAILVSQMVIEVAFVNGTEVPVSSQQPKMVIIV